MFDETKTVWNKIWKVLSIVVACLLLFIGITNIDSIDLDYKLLHNDIGLLWTIFWWLLAVCSLTKNMLLLQLLENVRRIKEKE